MDRTEPDQTCRPSRRGLDPLAAICIARPERFLRALPRRSKAAPSAWAATNTENTSAIRIRRRASSILLRNDLGGRSTELSEFYPYRYLASEGFLPGYNFTRLPMRVFFPTSDSSGEFISRPRSIALREFGPQNIIYYNGRKYRVCPIHRAGCRVGADRGQNQQKGRLLPHRRAERPGDLSILRPQPG